MKILNINAKYIPFLCVTCSTLLTSDVVVIVVCLLFDIKT